MLPMLKNVNFNIKVLTKGLVKGLKESTYAVTLKNEAFTIDYSFSNKRLECKATVPGSDFDPMATGILIKLAGCKCDLIHDL